MKPGVFVRVVLSPRPASRWWGSRRHHDRLRPREGKQAVYILATKKANGHPRGCDNIKKNLPAMQRELPDDIR